MSITYEGIVLLHGDQATEAMKALADDGQQAVLEYLKQWHEPGEGTLISTRSYPWKESDEIFKQGQYIMYYNLSEPYIGLVARLEF